jgi:transposase
MKIKLTSTTLSLACACWSMPRVVVFDFAESRGGRHAEQFFGDWRGTLVCDDFSGYKVLFRQGVTEAGCMAHARRKFHELWANHSSQIAGEALKLFGVLYDVERAAQALDIDQRQDIRL